MDIIKVEPRSADWHALRRTKSTASQAAAFVVADAAKAIATEAAKQGITLDIAPLLDVGITSFYGTTPWSVWAEKMGIIPGFAGNEDTERGQRNEERILRDFEEKNFFLIHREVTALSTAESFLLASFDGVLPGHFDPTVVAENGFPVEVKCPAFPTRKKMHEAYKAKGSYVLGTPHYWCQVQHQMYVADAPYAWFVAAGIEKDKVTGEEKLVFPIAEKVMRDDRFLAAYIPMVTFWYENYLDIGDEPPKIATDLVKISRLEAEAKVAAALKTSNIAEAVQLYREACEAEKALAEQRQALEAMLLKVATESRAEGENLIVLGDAMEISYTPRAGAVSWQKVAKALAAEKGLKDVPEDVQDKFRAKSTEAVKIRLLEEV